MRITKNQLRQVIKEELAAALSEQGPHDMRGVDDARKEGQGLAGISDPNKLEAGQNIYNPVTGDEYTVKSGDNLTRLASAWGTDVDSIMHDNQPGQTGYGGVAGGFRAIAPSERSLGRTPPFVRETRKR